MSEPEARGPEDHESSGPRASCALMKPAVTASICSRECDVQVQQEYAMDSDRLALGLRRPFPYRHDRPRHAPGLRNSAGAAATAPEPWTVPTTTPSQRHAR